MHTLTIFCLYRYMMQILNETLRWSVVGPYAARQQDTDTVIAGHHIPAGVSLYPSMLIVFMKKTKSCLLVCWYSVSVMVWWCDG